jgi:hypothetical protein
MLLLLEALGPGTSRLHFAAAGGDVELFRGLVRSGAAAPHLAAMPGLLSALRLGLVLGLAPESAAPLQGCLASWIHDACLPWSTRTAWLHHGAAHKAAFALLCALRKAMATQRLCTMLPAQDVATMVVRQLLIVGLA